MYIVKQGYSDAVHLPENVPTTLIQEITFNIARII